MANKLTYSEKLKDPRWQRKRLEILGRDNWACRFCSDTDRTLHVHHNLYNKNADPWDYPNEDLTTLCEDCHICVEVYKKKNAELIGGCIDRSIAGCVKVLKLRDIGSGRIFIRVFDQEDGRIMTLTDHAINFIKNG